MKITIIFLNFANVFSFQKCFRHWRIICKQQFSSRLLPFWITLEAAAHAIIQSHWIEFKSSSPSPVSIQLSSPSVEPLPSLTHSTAHPSFSFSLYPLTLIFAPSSLLPFPLFFSSLQYRQAEFPGGSGTAHSGRLCGAPNRLVALAEGSTWSARGEPMKGKKEEEGKERWCPSFGATLGARNFSPFGTVEGCLALRCPLRCWRLLVSVSALSLSHLMPADHARPSIHLSFHRCGCVCVSALSVLTVTANWVYHWLPSTITPYHFTSLLYLPHTFPICLSSYLLFHLSNSPFTLHHLRYQKGENATATE